AEDGIRDFHVTGVQTCALPISFTVVAGKLNAVTSTTDSTPPTLTAFSFPATTVNVTGADAAVTVNFQVADNLSGAKSVLVSFTRSEERRVGDEFRFRGCA